MYIILCIPLLAGFCGSVVEGRQQCQRFEIFLRPGFSPLFVAAAAAEEPAAEQPVAEEPEAASASAVKRCG